MSAIKKLFIFIMLFTMIAVTMYSATAFEAESASFDIWSYHLGLSGSVGESTSYTIRGTTTIQGSNDNAFSTSYDADSGIYPEEMALDTLSPNITINFPPNNYNTTNGTIVINTTVNDTYSINNVTLYGNWNNWSVKATNSSGGNNIDYFFNVSLYDGNWTFAIGACDVSGNCFITENRTIIVDNTTPEIYLIYPENASTISATNLITFAFNATDNIGIHDCILVIDNVTVIQNRSITNGTNYFQRYLSNDNYEWYINCTDYANNTVYSNIYLLEVQYLVTGSAGGAEKEAAINISSLARAVDTEIIRSRNMKILLFLSCLYFGWLIFAAKRDEKQKKKERDIFLKEK